MAGVGCTKEQNKYTHASTFELLIASRVLTGRLNMRPMPSLDPRRTSVSSAVNEVSRIMLPRAKYLPPRDSCAALQLTSESFVTFANRNPVRIRLRISRRAVLYRTTYHIPCLCPSFGDMLLVVCTKFYLIWPSEFLAFQSLGSFGWDLCICRCRNFRNDPEFPEFSVTERLCMVRRPSVI